MRTLAAMNLTIGRIFYRIWLRSVTEGPSCSTPCGRRPSEKFQLAVTTSLRIATR
jgi:hypothetical protein